jgi:ankyrin repeat protein
MFRLLMMFGVFFPAFFWHFARAESAPDPQGSDWLLPRRAHDGPEDPDSRSDSADLCASGVVPERHTKKNPSHGEGEMQELHRRSGEIQEAWRDCSRMLARPCSKDSEEYQEVEALFERYPDLVCAVDGDGRNLLMIAVQQNNEGMATLLIPYYVQHLDLQDAYGYSALFYAIRNRSKYLIALALFYGARTDIPNREGFDAIQFSCTLENLEMFYFIEGTLEKLEGLKLQKEVRKIIRLDKSSVWLASAVKRS